MTRTLASLAIALTFVAGATVAHADSFAATTKPTLIGALAWRRFGDTQRADPVRQKSRKESRPLRRGMLDVSTSFPQNSSENKFPE